MCLNLLHKVQGSSTIRLTMSACTADFRCLSQTLSACTIGDVPDNLNVWGHASVCTMALAYSALRNCMGANPHGVTGNSTLTLW